MKLRKALVLVLSLLLTISVAMPVVASPPVHETLWTIVFSAESLPANVEELVARAGASVTYAVPKIGVLQVKGSLPAAQSLSRMPGVMGVAASIPMMLPTLQTETLEQAVIQGMNGPGDLYQTHQWDIKRVTNNGASWAMDGGLGDHSVVVGVVDTGLYSLHPDLADNYLGGRNFVPAGGIGNELYETGDPDDVTDFHGHGTHTAGAIAANGRVYGVGPNLGIRAYKVVSGAGLGAFEWIAAGAIAAVDDGVDVISFSLGGRLFLGQVFYVDPNTGSRTAVGNDAVALTVVQRALRYAVRQGVTVVVAAGNDGLNMTRKHDATAYYEAVMKELGMPFEVEGASFGAPAGMPGVVTVTATGPDDSLASYANYGHGFVTLAAPGGDFVRRPQPDWLLDMSLNAWSPLSQTLPGAMYAFSAGTSMATPKVAAIAGLIIAKEGKIGPQQVIRRLKAAAEDLGPTGTDAYYGWGLSNAYGALDGE